MRQNSKKKLGSLRRAIEKGFKAIMEFLEEVFHKIVYQGIKDKKKVGDKKYKTTPREFMDIINDG